MSLRRRTFVAIFWFAAGFASTTWAAKVVVRDSQQKPIPFARVAVLNQPGWMVADEEGTVRLPEDLQPPFTLVVTGSDGVLLGSFYLTDQLSDGQVLTVQKRQEELTVTASRSPDLVVAPATAFGVVSTANLSFRAPAQLTDVLDAIPNVGRLEEGHSVVPALRGMARFRSLVLLDGSRVFTERRAGPSATFLDPLSLGEVEVVRGAAGVAYGSDAFGGVIAARTPLALPGEPWGLRYYLLTGTGVPEKTAHVEAGGTLGRGALTLALGARDFSRYRSPMETVYNSEATFRSARVGYQVPVGEGLLRLSWRSDWGRDVGKPALDSRVTRSYYPEENSHRLVVGYEAPMAGPWIRYAWSLSWVEYQLITVRDTFATDTKPRTLTQADVFSHDYNARFEAERQLFGGRVLFGADAYGRFGLKATNDQYTFTTGGPDRTREVSIASARKDDFGLFAALNRNFQTWDLALGVRADHTQAKNTGGYFGNRNFDFTRGSGFAALTFRPVGGWEVSLQYARGFRDAVLSDRFYRGISGRGFITGNPDLKPETSKQWDLALRYSAPSWRVAIYGYRYRIFDFIERYRQGSNYFFRNRAEAELRGLEGELTWVVFSSTTLSLGLQYPEGKVATDRTYLDDIPARGGFLLLRQQRGAFSWETRFAAYARDTRPGPAEATVPGYAVWDLGASWQLSRQLEVGLYGRNVLDRAYPGSADASAVLAPGRSVQLSLRGYLGL